MFETFKKESINCFELEPVYYLSTTSYSQDVMLRLKGVNLKLLLDIEKYRLVKFTIQGGDSVICRSYAEADNIFLKSRDANSH